jgi:hypothetical protein
MRAVLIGAPYDPSALDIDGISPPHFRAVNIFDANPGVNGSASRHFWG